QRLLAQVRRARWRGDRHRSFRRQRAGRGAVPAFRLHGRGRGRRRARALKREEGRLAMAQREWVARAIHTIEADFNRSADTHLIPMELPGYPGIDVYLKDESSHPTGSLKHRLARSLFLYALANG